MAVRSGAGTGVVVSLIVFILTSVFLLVLCIVFYTGKTNEMEERIAAKRALDQYVSSSQRNSDEYKTYESNAKANNMSVSAYLSKQYQDLMKFVDADPNQTVSMAKDRFKGLGVDNDGVIRTSMSDLSHKLKTAETDRDNLQTQLNDCNAKVAEKEAQIAQMKKDNEEALAQVGQQVEPMTDANKIYKNQVDAAVAGIEQAKEQMKSRYESRITDLSNDLEKLNQERVLLIGRLNELEQKVSASRIKPTSPDLLVDGHIIDVAGSHDQVFIDRGKNDRIVLGMTFEVYDEARNIVPDLRTNEVVPGKASLQVIQVGDTSSKCKITRATAGRPVVKGDIIANAVYDPKYRFKFLIHGTFDVDGDGRPTSQETEYLKSLVMDWGGTVVTGETIPGDLDFLVLGVKPPMPPPLPTDATEVQINDQMRKRRAVDVYESLMKQATDAQIPVLNANRFFILIGHTGQ
ncbi:MAG TPA: hypothetical protein VG711_03805 [Phycisphaerales bacterium]|nr:hypothetical protein [Phycisphaerales bacterium]